MENDKYNETLRKMFEEDQTERLRPPKDADMNEYWAEMAENDMERRKTVRKMEKEGKINAALDYMCASAILQHGVYPEDFLEAHEFASKALDMEPTKEEIEAYIDTMAKANGIEIKITDEEKKASWEQTAKFWTAATMDRYLQSTGKPQKYGTQFLVMGGKTYLYEVDASVSDEERAKYGQPPLSVLESKFYGIITAEELKEITETERKELLKQIKEDILENIESDGLESTEEYIAMMENNHELAEEEKFLLRIARETIEEYKKKSK